MMTTLSIFVYQCSVNNRSILCMNPHDGFYNNSTQGIIYLATNAVTGAKVNFYIEESHVYYTNIILLPLPSFSLAIILH